MIWGKSLSHIVIHVGTRWPWCGAGATGWPREGSIRRHWLRSSLSVSHSYPEITAFFISQACRSNAVKQHRLQRLFAALTQAEQLPFFISVYRGIVNFDTALMRPANPEYDKKYPSSAVMRVLNWSDASPVQDNLEPILVLIVVFSSLKDGPWSLR